MTTLFLLLLSIFMPISSYADWAPEDLAPYEIIDNHVEAIVDASGLADETYTMELKSRNDQGRNILVMQSISFVPDIETIQVLSASSETNGVHTPVDLSTITTRAGKGMSGGISNIQEIVIPFTNILANSSIKYTYNRKTKKVLVPKLFEAKFVFGWQAPERSSSAKIVSKLPLFYSFTGTNNILDIKSSRVGEDYVLEFRQKKSVFRFPLEFNPILGTGDTLGLSISTLNDWSVFSKSLAEKYENLLEEKLPPQLQAIAEKAKVAPTLEAKIDIVTSELAEIMTYSGNWTSLERMFYPQSLSKIAINKTGDCKDYSMATTAILRSIGIKSNIALTFRNTQYTNIGLITTHRDISSINVNSIFNHAIVKVESENKVLWVDPTNSVSDSKYIFSDIAGSEALELNMVSAKLERIPIPSSDDSFASFTKKIKITEDGSAESVTDFQLKGEFAKYVLETNLSKNGDEAKKLIATFLRTDSSTGKNFYEGFNLSSRKSRELKGSQKSFGEKILHKKDEKQYLIVPLPTSLSSYMNIADKRVTDLNLVSRFKEMSVIQVEGFDFVDFQVGCNIYSPWFTIERRFIKNEKGFEIRDNIESQAVRVSLDTVNSRKFQLSTSDIRSCAGTQAVQVVKLNGESLEKRMTLYTTEKLKELDKILGPESVSSAEKAFHVADQILSVDPKNKMASLIQGRSLRLINYKHDGINRDEYDEQYKLIMLRADKMFPNDPQVQLYWTSYYLSTDNHEASLASFKKTWELGLRSSRLYIFGGDILKKSGNLEGAKKSFLQAIATGEDSLDRATAAGKLGRLYLEEDNFSESIIYMKKSLEYYPKNTWLHGSFVRLLTSLKRLDEAISEGEKMLLAGDYGIGRHYVASAYYAKAEELLSKLSSEDPLWQQETTKVKLKEIESLYQKSIKHFPEHTHSLTGLGTLYQRMAKQKNDQEYALKSLNLLEKAEKNEDRHLLSSQELMISNAKIREALRQSRELASPKRPTATPISN